MEGYFEETGRAGLGHTGFDYEKMKGLPPLPEEGAHSLDEMWNNMTYFLKAVVPVAQESHVRLALHPNDPPAPISRGSWQIMGTVAGWKKLISIVDSPSNGITFDCGVTREMGEDPVEVCRYFASRDRINHMHYRNVRVIKPYERYTEVAIDEGQVDLFGVMKELVRNKYTRTIYPEHPRLFDYDREYAKLTTGGRVGGYPGGGGYTGNVFNVAYARAMMQAALESV
jgi:mannonate dehydratase